MNRRLNNFFAMDAYYTDLLSNHGVKKRSIHKMTSAYDSFNDFKNNLKAPIQIPLVILSSNLKAIIGCIENTLHLAINLLTLDCSDAHNNCISILNNVSFMLYQSVRALVDMTVNLIALPVCSLITLKEVMDSPQRVECA